MNKNLVQEHSSSSQMLLKDLGLVQWAEEIHTPDLDAEDDKEDIYLQISDNTEIPEKADKKSSRYLLERKRSGCE